jgi:hypothetical protein
MVGRFVVTKLPVVCVYSLHGGECIEWTTLTIATIAGDSH